MTTYLNAAMRVIRAHQHRPSLTIAETAEAVKNLALRISSGTAGPSQVDLATKLERATGCSVVVLAVYAEDWPHWN